MNWLHFGLGLFLCVGSVALIILAELIGELVLVSVMTTIGFFIFCIGLFLIAGAVSDGR